MPRPGSGNRGERSHTVVFPDNSGSDAQTESGFDIFGTDKERETVLFVGLQIAGDLSQIHSAAGVFHINTAAAGDKDLVIQLHRLFFQILFLL